ncbi:hypothetical protein pneo_cds_799 [Pandoravirus neocaledonia]|uniref:Uncharacterized protein n=1 Tax=Pandoravirus neocaledonia TaxID=2107708 RepID=A0A2U7UD97_9VIRU|nr:hypothetical protein pneo_cds_799 [Pandoravirus neocaledonia]AVK76406.1 hypothetical protein pneo_cds_799 [Pandoravirus neocaledonia]
MEDHEPTDNGLPTDAGLPAELWWMIVERVDRAWQPVAAHVCGAWRRAVPDNQRRLDVMATYALWSHPHCINSPLRGAILAWSLGVSRASRGLATIKRLRPLPRSAIPGDDDPDGRLMAATLLYKHHRLDALCIVVRHYGDGRRDGDYEVHPVLAYG